MNEKVDIGRAGLAAKRVYRGQRIAEWKRAGQSQKAFCVQRSLPLSTFQWWCARAKREAAKAVKPFLPIALHAPSVVEVELRSRTLGGSNEERSVVSL